LEAQSGPPVDTPDVSLPEPDPLVGLALLVEDVEA
jgi:hypothetical protein